MSAELEFTVDDVDAIQKFTGMMDRMMTIQEQALDQAIQGDGPIPRQLDVFKNDMDYACERLVLRWEIRERLMIDTETGELV